MTSIFFIFIKKNNLLKLLVVILSSLDFKKYLHIISDDKKNFEEILESAFLKLDYTENLLFDLCLPIYLEQNDEPIWTDFSDTINVISTVFEDVNSNSYQCSSNREILKSSQNISRLLSFASIFIFSLSLEFAITPPPPDIFFTPVSLISLKAFKY